MSFFFVDPQVYRKYRDEILDLSNSIQVNLVEHLPADKRPAPLTDAMIAEKLGLDSRTVTEIRCVAEREYYDLDEWEKALRFKDKACREYAAQGLSSVTKKYFQKKQK